MSLALSRLLLALALFGIFALTGCDAVPISKHPLSDATDSVLDERLYGQWDVYNDEKPAEEPAKEEGEKKEPEPDRLGPGRFILGKVADQEKTHELVTYQVSDIGVIETKRQPFFVTRIGERQFVSMNMAAPEAAPEYAILRYEFANENRVLVYMLDRDFIIAAIQKGELNGSVKTVAPSEDPNAVKRRESIHITAKVAELRAFLKKHDKMAFTAKHALRLQRAEQG
ncbi:hypothetical protein [Anatilimnocola floriformis]|uniref:hypothetical protein n=1 Tax=Anatilimnocola floriformis TaxID=2948575 RepID=UPI0020C36C1D|nr:hypothetical protein [Anatilimnocola floriformis]